MADLQDRLISKIKVLNETIWEQRAGRQQVEEWLSNFGPGEERLHALWLLSQFMYFGSREMRELLRALFRDLVKYPIVASIRQARSNTRDHVALGEAFSEELQHTRFLGMGNPSESGCHLLYYFRQENKLPKALFIHTHEIFHRIGATGAVTLRFPDATRYVYLDDFCGSGDQASQYSSTVLEDVKRLKPDTELAYYVLFATESGLQQVRHATCFDRVDAVFVLDDTYKCFGAASRCFVAVEPGITKECAERISRSYGQTLWARHPLGYKDGQLLLGFHHNTPDNTLPIIWYDEETGPAWTPIFRRYPKIYGWGGA